MDLELLLLDGSQQLLLLLQEYSFVVHIPSLLGFIIWILLWDGIKCVSVDVKTTIIKHGLNPLQSILEHQTALNVQVLAQVPLRISHFVVSLPLIELNLLAPLNSSFVKLS